MGDEPVDVWPSRRPDGSASVAIRFQLDEELSAASLDAAVQGWLRERSDSQLAAIAADLRASPSVHEAGTDSIDVVIHTRAGRGYYARDWLVVLTCDLRAALPRVTLLGFRDVVSGRFRPAREGVGGIPGDEVD